VRQVAVGHPRRAGRRIDVREEIGRLALRNRVIVEPDPGMPAARGRLAEAADEVRDPFSVPTRLGAGLLSVDERDDLHGPPTIPAPSEGLP
jgi:hypothetical protein